MAKFTKYFWFRAVATILVISFITLDIAWANPSESATLNIPTLFHEVMRTELAAKSLAISGIGKFLLGDAETGEKPFELKYLQSTMSAEIRRGLDGIDLSKVALKDNGIILIPFKNDRGDFLFQVALKDNPAIREAAGYEGRVSDKYIVKIAARLRTGEEPAVDAGQKPGEPITTTQKPAAAPLATAARDEKRITFDEMRNRYMWMPLISFGGVKFFNEHERKAYTVKDLATDSSKQSEVIRFVQDSLRLDVVFTMMDLSSWPEAVYQANKNTGALPVRSVFGAKHIDQEGRLFGPSFPLTKENIAKLNVPTIGHDGRTHVFINAMASLSRTYGHKVAKVGYVIGPFTLAARLVGEEDAALAMLDDPETFGALLDYCVKVSAREANAYAAAGADAIVILEPSTAIMTPSHYDECITRRVNSVAAAAKNRGIGVIFHGCGDSTPFLNNMVGLDVDAYSIDEKVDLAKAYDVLTTSGKYLIGNIMASEITPSKSPDALSAEVSSIMEQFAHRDRFLLGLTCEMPFDTSMEQITGIMDGVLSHYEELYQERDEAADAARQKPVASNMAIGAPSAAGIGASGERSAGDLTSPVRKPGKPIVEDDWTSVDWGMPPEPVVQSAPNAGIEPPAQKPVASNMAIEDPIIENHVRHYIDEIIRELVLPADPTLPVEVVKNEWIRDIQKAFDCALVELSGTNRTLVEVLQLRAHGFTLAATSSRLLLGITKERVGQLQGKAEGKLLRMVRQNLSEAGYSDAELRWIGFVAHSPEMLQTVTSYFILHSKLGTDLPDHRRAAAGPRAAFSSNDIPKYMDDGEFGLVAAYLRWYWDDWRDRVNGKDTGSKSLSEEFDKIIDVIARHPRRYEFFASDAYMRTGLKMKEHIQETYGFTAGAPSFRVSSSVTKLVTVLMVALLPALASAAYPSAEHAAADQSMAQAGAETLFGGLGDAISANPVPVLIAALIIGTVLVRAVWRGYFPLSWYSRRLRSGNCNVRHGAISALGEMGARGIEPLVKVLEDSDEYIRVLAVEALGRIGDPRAIGPIIKALGSERAHLFLCRPAAEALRKIGAPAVEPLIEALQNADRTVRHAASLALQKIGDPRAIEPLIVSLKGGRVFYESATVDALAKFGEPAVEPLMKAAGDPDPSVRQGALMALSKMATPRALELIISGLTNTNIEVRAYAAQALGRIGDRRAVDPLINALSDESSLVGISAVEALVKIGDRRAVKHLILAMGSTHRYVRKAALEALGGWWRPVTREEAIPYLIAKGSWDELQKTGIPAVEALIKVLGDTDDSSARQNAALTLLRIGDSRLDFMRDYLRAMTEPVTDHPSMQYVVLTAGEIGYIVACLQRGTAVDARYRHYTAHRAVIDSPAKLIVNTGEAQQDGSSTSQGFRPRPGKSPQDALLKVIGRSEKLQKGPFTLKDYHDEYAVIQKRYGDIDPLAENWQTTARNDLYGEGLAGMPSLEKQRLLRILPERTPQNELQFELTAEGKYALSAFSTTEMKQGGDADKIAPPSRETQLADLRIARAYLEALNLVESKKNDAALAAQLNLLRMLSADSGAARRFRLLARPVTDRQMRAPEFSGFLMGQAGALGVLTQQDSSTGQRLYITRASKGVAAHTAVDYSVLSGAAGLLSTGSVVGLIIGGAVGSQITEKKAAGMHRHVYIDASAVTTDKFMESVGKSVESAISREDLARQIGRLEDSLKQECAKLTADEASRRMDAGQYDLVLADLELLVALGMEKELRAYPDVVRDHKNAGAVLKLIRAGWSDSLMLDGEKRHRMYTMFDLVGMPSKPVAALREAEERAGSINAAWEQLGSGSDDVLISLSAGVDSGAWMRSFRNMSLLADLAINVKGTKVVVSGSEAFDPELSFDSETIELCMTTGARVWAIFSKNARQAIVKKIKDELVRKSSEMAGEYPQLAAVLKPLEQRPGDAKGQPRASDGTFTPLPGKSPEDLEKLIRRYARSGQKLTAPILLDLYAAHWEEMGFEKPVKIRKHALKTIQRDLFSGPHSLLKQGKVVEMAFRGLDGARVFVYVAANPFEEAVKKRVDEMADSLTAKLLFGALPSQFSKLAAWDLVKRARKDLGITIATALFIVLMPSFLLAATVTEGAVAPAPVVGGLGIPAAFIGVVVISAVFVVSILFELVRNRHENIEALTHARLANSILAQGARTVEARIDVILKELPGSMKRIRPALTLAKSLADAPNGAWEDVYAARKGMGLSIEDLEIVRLALFGPDKTDVTAAQPRAESRRPEKPGQSNMAVEDARTEGWNLKKASEEVALIQKNLAFLWDSDIEAIRRMANAIMQGDTPLTPQSYARLVAEYNTYLAGNELQKANSAQYALAPDERIVYFCMEYGLTEQLNTYGGGLGILAGDHLRGASDRYTQDTFVGVGLAWNKGYFQQAIEPSGRSAGEQVERYPVVPLEEYAERVRIKEKDGRETDLVIKVEAPDNKYIYAKAWRVRAGRAELYLLDTDIPENDGPEALAFSRAITWNLYAANEREWRLRQEYLLGIGGMRLLEQLGIKPAALHINEGHAAFVALELIQDELERKAKALNMTAAEAVDIRKKDPERARSLGISFEQALATVKSKIGFTSHTPIPAGNEEFDPALFQYYFRQYCLLHGLDIDALMKIAVSPSKALGGVNMANLSKLAIALSADVPEAEAAKPIDERSIVTRNGVSRKGGEVSKELYDDESFGAITNSVHRRFWQSPVMRELLETRWLELQDRGAVPKKAIELLSREERAVYLKVLMDNITNEELLQAQRRMKAEAVQHLAATRGVMLDKDAFTIVVSRRFASYKRLGMILGIDDAKSVMTEDFEGQILDKLIRAAQEKSLTKLQIVFAGKAHAQDQAGKDIIAKINKAAATPKWKDAIVFVPDYDIDVAKDLIQIATVWENNPIPPHEASGTSGEKAAANGVMSVSTPDGWVIEADPRSTVFLFGKEGHYNDIMRLKDDARLRRQLDEQDVRELEDMYMGDWRDQGTDREKGIIDMYRNHPERWAERVRGTIYDFMVNFDMPRFIEDYEQKMYLPLVRGGRQAESSAIAQKPVASNMTSREPAVDRAVSIGARFNKDIARAMMGSEKFGDVLKGVESLVVAGDRDRELIDICAALRADKNISGLLSVLERERLAAHARRDVNGHYLARSQRVDELYRLLVTGTEGAARKPASADMRVAESGPGTPQEAKNVTELFEIVENTINNERARVVKLTNQLSDHLVQGVSETHVKVEDTAAKIKAAAEEVAELAEHTGAPWDDEGAREMAAELRTSLKQFEADSIVGALIVLARRAKFDNQKLIIGLETDWIPGYNEQGSYQQNAISSLVREIASLDQTLRSMGLDNVVILHKGGDELAQAISDTVAKTNTKLTNVVVFGSQTTLGSEDFQAFWSAPGDPKAFMGIIDPTEIDAFYKEHKDSIDAQLTIRLMEMLCLTLELAVSDSKELPPQMPVKTWYDKDRRAIIFLPKVEKADYEAIRRLYNAARTALQAA